MAGVKEKIDKTIDTAKVLKRAERAERKAAKDSGTQTKGTGASGVSNTRRKPGYTKEKADEVLEHISNGMTVTQACARAGIKRLDFLRWTEVVPDLKAEYSVALKRLAGALVDGVLIETQGIENESQSRVVLNKSKIVQWAAGSLDNEMWGAKKAYEFGGQIKMQHTHELTVEQRERIAQAWLMARDNSLPKGKATVVIEAEPVYKEVEGELKLLEVEESATIKGVPASRKIEERVEAMTKEAERAANPELDAGYEKPEHYQLLKRLGQKVLNNFPSADRLAQQSIAKTKAELEAVK